ncbi:MAG: YHS domain-containing protein [Deltaproteobacteria bacterium]|nr:YHS domain-containing protein [Deltaproteobacteria bacterium]
MRLIAVCLAVCLALAACSGPAKPDPSSPTTTTTSAPVKESDKILVNVDGDGVGLGGHDPVSYREDDPMFGSDANVAEHGGAKYRFASADNKAKFEADKAKLAPGFGGYCAFAAAQNRVQRADPTIFTIHDGQLLVFTNRSFKTMFNKDPAGNKKAADANWPALVAKHGKPAR